MNYDFNYRVIRFNGMYYFQKQFSFSSWETLSGIYGKTLQDLTKQIEDCSNFAINYRYSRYSEHQTNLEWVWTKKQMKAEFPEWFV